MFPTKKGLKIVFTFMSHQERYFKPKTKKHHPNTLTNILVHTREKRKHDKFRLCKHDMTISNNLQIKMLLHPTQITLAKGFQNKAENENYHFPET
jgi:hypothetical protein